MLVSFSSPSTTRIRMELHLKPGYVSRAEPLYFDDRMPPGLNYQPDVYDIAAKLADLAGFSTVVDIGCGTASKLVELRTRARTIGVDFGANLGYCRDQHPDREWVEVDLEKQSIEPATWAAWGPAVIICADVIEHLVDPSALLRSITNGVAAGGIAVISTPDRDLVRGEADLGPPANPHHIREWSAIELARLLASAGLRILRFGHTRNNDRDGLMTTITAIVAGSELDPDLRARVLDPGNLRQIQTGVPEPLLDRAILRDATIIVKTFERPACVARLVNSIRAFYAELPVLVADDSSCPEPVSGATCFALPFDSGLGAARNYLLERIATKYFVLCDDDFVFTPETRIEVFLNLLDKENLDLVGGRLRLGPAFQTHHGLLELRDGCLVKSPGGRGQFATHELCDIVLNFFGARTSEVRAIGGWDPRLKLCEHALFFLNGLGRLRVAHTPLVVADHCQQQEPSYMEYRRRALRFFFQYCGDYGIRDLIEMDGTRIEPPSD